MTFGLEDIKVIEGDVHGDSSSIYNEIERLSAWWYFTVRHQKFRICHWFTSDMAP